MSKLKDRVAIITGASSGIGRSIAEAFAAEGARLVLASRKKERLDLISDNINKSGGSALAVPTDVSIESEIKNLFEKCMEAYKRVDILVNNAGIAIGMPTDQLTLETWRKVLDVNLTGAFICSREAFKIMKEQKGGRIINIGSVSSKVPRFNSAPYTTSKFALEGLTRSLALDGRQYGIAVSIIHPGNVATEMWKDLEEVPRREGVMSPDELARIALLIATLPQDMNLLESVVLPVSMPLLGRG